MTLQRADIIVGAGPAGLATAAMLRIEGRDPLVLDLGERVGQSWLRRYECLRLNTTRWWSSLPGLPIPRKYGTWVKAADYASYLGLYARHHSLDVWCGTSVQRIDRGDGRWLVATSAGAMEADNVIVAAGYDRLPFVPAWPGKEEFGRDLIHSSAYRNARPFVQQGVLVVGGGNSGTDIAVDLARAGASVWLSLRTPPQIVPRTIAGLPMQTVAICARGLPAWVGDSIVKSAQRLVHGDLTRFGIAAPVEPLSAQFSRGDVVPVIDVDFVRAVKRGLIKVVAAVEAFEGSRVILSDQSVLSPAVVIAATGYRRGLESLVGHLQVLEPDGRPAANGPHSPSGANGLFFVGYTNPLSGNLRELSIDSKRTARAIALRSVAALTERTVAPDPPQPVPASQ